MSQNQKYVEAAIVSEIITAAFEFRSGITIVATVYSTEALQNM